MLAGVEGDEVLLNIDEQGATQTIGLEFELLSDAKLLLTDELIALMLKQRKDAGTLPPGAEAGAGIGDGKGEGFDFDESAFDEIEADTDITDTDDTETDQRGDPAASKE